MSASKRASVKDKSPLDELFRKTEPPEEQGEPAREVEAKKPKADRKRATPQDKRGKPRQTSIMLYDHQIEWLDQKCIEARRDGGKPIRKAVLIRSLLDVAMSAPVQLEGLANEEQLVERLEKAIRSK